MLTPENIYNKRFDKTRVSGYKTEDVDVFLEEVAKTVADLTAQNRELEEKIEVLAEKIEEYRSDEDNLKTAILGAQRLGDSVVREARHKAEVLINEAKAQAAEIVENAQSKIDREQVALTRLQREVALFKEN